MIAGYSILVASWKDIYSDWVTNNRSLGHWGNVNTMYKYGFLGMYGVGFSFPLLLGLPGEINTFQFKLYKLEIITFKSLNSTF